MYNLASRCAVSDIFFPGSDQTLLWFPHWSTHLLLLLQPVMLPCNMWKGAVGLKSHHMNQSFRYVTFTYSVNVFPSSQFSPSHESKKTPKVTIKTFVQIRFFFSNVGVSIIFSHVHKNRALEKKAVDMKHGSSMR